MSEPKLPEIKMPDPAEVAETMARIAEQSRKVVNEFLERQALGGGDYSVLDPGVIARSFQELYARMAADPSRLVEAQLHFWQDYTALCQGALQRMMGGEARPVVEPERGDKRFKDEEWQDNPIFDYIKQSYLLASRYLLGCVRETEDPAPHTAEKVDVHTRQFLDAVAPAAARSKPRLQEVCDARLHPKNIPRSSDPGQPDRFPGSKADH